MTIPFNVFGDSFSQGVGSSNPSVLGYVPLLAAAQNFAVSNYSVSGGEAGDQAAAIFGVIPSCSSLYFIGLNDQRHWATNPVNIAAFTETVMAEALWLSVANTNLVLSTSPSVTYTGGWGSNVAPVYGNLPRYTDTMGETCSFTLTGNSLYIVTIQQDGSAGQEQISIDGVSQGTFNVAPASPITTALGVPYMPKCYHFEVGGLPTASHTVEITKTNATVVGSRIYFMFAWGNGMGGALPYPLYLAGPTPCTPAGYAASAIAPAVPSFASTAAYDASMQTVQQTLANDGLNVRLVNVAQDCFAERQTDSGGCHPNDEGHWQLAVKFSAAIQ